MWISKSPSSDSPYAGGAGAAMPAAMPAATRAEEWERSKKSASDVPDDGFPEKKYRSGRWGVSHHAHSRIRPRARDTPHVNSRSTSGQFDGHRQHVPFLRVRSRRRPLRPQVRPPPDAFAAFFYTLAIFRAFPCRATDPPRPRTPPDEQKGRQEGGSALGGRVREEVRVPPHPRAPTPGVTTHRDPKRTETTRMGPGACDATDTHGGSRKDAERRLAKCGAPGDFRALPRPHLFLTRS